MSSSSDLEAARHLMVEREVSHVVVVERHTKRPLGVLSTLDVTRALAGFPERHPRG
jgi:CBS domain-containing protein